MVEGSIALIPNSKIQITNSFGYADGAGAQVQRILSLIAFSTKHNLDFVLNPIRKVEIQPIDTLTQYEDLLNNIDELNAWLGKKFNCKESGFGNNLIEVKGAFGLIANMLKLFISGFFTKDKNIIGLSFLDGYFETKANPETWKLLNKYGSKIKNSDRELKFAHIHFRLSTFSNNSDRNVPMSYYKRIMEELEIEARRMNFDLFFVVHTDFRGNLTDRNLFIEHAVPQSLNYWIELGVLTENYEVDIEFVSEARESLNLLLSEFSNVIFFTEKSWVVEWEAMSDADYLVASKSSFSLIGGILNHSGTIYVPESWSLGLSSWRSRD